MNIISYNDNSVYVVIDGEIFIWEIDNLINPERVIFFDNILVYGIFCGTDFAVATTNSGVFSWGGNDVGQLGIGSDLDHFSMPQKINFFDDKNIKTITCGRGVVFAITDIGNVFSWGDNYCGILGMDHLEDHFNRPQLLNFFDEKNIEKIECGSAHGAALADYKVYTWGCNCYSQLGICDSNVSNAGLALSLHSDETCFHLPKRVDFFDAIKVVDIVCGELCTMAISDDNQVYAWGYNANFQFGLCVTKRNGLCVTKRNIKTPTRINVSSQSVVCSDHNTLVIDEHNKMHMLCIKHLQNYNAEIFSNIQVKKIIRGISVYYDSVILSIDVDGILYMYHPDKKQVYRLNLDDGKPVVISQPHHVKSARST